MEKEIFEDEKKDVGNLDNTSVLDIKDENEFVDSNKNLGNSNNKKPNKKNMIIIISVLLLLVIIITSVVLLNNTGKKDDEIVDKETVLIDGKNYVIFETTELILDSNSLTLNDINNISKLENLKKLDIRNTILDDISFLENLKKLNVIKIGVSTKVIDYTVFKSMDNLFTLEIYGSIGKSADMSVFSELNKVSTLYLTIVNDRDMSFIKEMSGLSLLSIDCSVELYNKVLLLLENTKVRIEKHGKLLNTNTPEPSDPNTIEDGVINWSQYDVNTTEVISINLTSDYNDIKLLQKELDKLSNYTNLKSLIISNEEYATPYSVENFNFLKSLTKLESLSISNLNANDISAIGNLLNLKKLVLTNGNMANSKFSAISNLIKLESLNLSMQNITDITFLSNLTNIQKLYLSGNNFSSIEPVKKLTELNELYIGCNDKLKNYSSLSSLQNLNTLMITLDNIDINVFSNLKKLKTLYVGISFEKIDEFKTTYPNIDIQMVSECA